MPTLLPRVNVPFEKGTFIRLEELSRREKASLSETVRKLVDMALSLSEDLALAGIARERMASYKRKDAFTTDELLRRIDRRRK